MGSDFQPTVADNEQLLNSLLKEYELTVGRLDRVDDRTIQLLGVGVALLGAFSSFILSQAYSLPLGLAWVVPLIFLIVFALLLYNYYFAANYLWICRTLSMRINMMLPEVAHIGHEPDLPPGIFFSTRRGNPKPRIVYALLIGGVIALFLLASYTSFSEIYRIDHLAGTTFILIYGFLAILELFALTGPLRDLPNTYRKFLELVGRLSRIPRGFEYRQSELHAPDLKATLLLLIPRPLDVLAKGQIYWLGFVAALIAKGMTTERLPLLNLLFRGLTDWKDIGEVPGGAIFALGLLFFVVEELLLQQAKLLWDDIRDVERDRVLLQNKARAIASGHITIQAAINHTIIRWVLALGCAYILAGKPLLLIFLIITLHQMLYVLWTKPNAERYPLLPLAVVSFNVALRFIAGAIVVLGADWAITPFLIMVVMLYFYSLGGMAAQWKIEAEYQQQTGRTIAVRPQSPY